MPTCPVCTELVDADEAAFQHHVNGHFDTGGSSSLEVENGLGRVLEDEQLIGEECPICAFPLGEVSLIDKERHINSCLDGLRPAADIKGFVPREPTSENSSDFDLDFDYSRENIQRTGQAANDLEGDEDWVQVGWTGPAKPGGWHDWVHRKTERGDKWWDPSTSTTDPSKVPANFCPSLLPVLYRLLTLASSGHITRHAVLCSPTTLIRGVWGFDMGWGCGYRNAQMVMDALLQFPFRPEYRDVFDAEKNGSEPGLRRIQGWIEEAWGEGFDPGGRQHFRGKLLGTRKWIGPTDMYAMFSYKGIPCEIYDFPKPQGGRGMPRTAHIALQQWVRKYFSEDDESNKHGYEDQSAFDVIMRKSQGGQGRGNPVGHTSKLPLVLQHSGHSRTIVGYEETAQGNINLLLFDPGKSMSKELRNAGLEELQADQQRRVSIASTASSTSLPQRNGTLRRSDTHSSNRPSLHPSPSRQTLRRTSTSQATHEPVPFSPPYTNGASEFVHVPTPSEDGSDDDIIPMEEDTAQSPNHRLPNPPTPEDPFEDPIDDDNNDEPVEVLRDDEERDQAGWVRKKVVPVAKSMAPFALVRDTSKPLWEDGPGGLSKALGYFRVNLSKLSSHTEYQVLAFTGGPLLTSRERRERMEMSSTVVR